MFGILILILPISVLAIVATMAWAILNEAFRLDVISGGATAIPCRTPYPVKNLAAAVRGLAAGNGLSMQVNVEQCGSCIPRVTAPEASAIAEELRARGHREVSAVLQRSRRNGDACPMLSESGFCACTVARPLSCIDRCTLGVDSPEWAAGLGQTTADAFQHHLKSHHLDAATRRLDDALLSIFEGSR